MKKLVALEPRIARFKDYEDREIGKNEMCIRVIFATPKPGTEIVDFRGLSLFVDEELSEEQRLFLPREEGNQRGVVFDEFQLGSMIAGMIEETGSLVIEHQKGELVCTYGSIREMLIISGVDDCRLCKLDRLDQWKNAVCYDPAQFALGDIREAHIRAGDAVVIFGLGAIGQIAIQLARKAGAATIAGIGPIAQCRELAERYGADYTLGPMKTDVGLHLKESTDKRGIDSVIEMSGSAIALQASLKGIGYGGIVSYVAFAKPFPAGSNLGRGAHFNSVKIVFAQASSKPNPDYPGWNHKRIEDTCWELSTNGYPDCGEITDPVVPLAESAKAYMRHVDQHPEESVRMGVQVRRGGQWNPVHKIKHLSQETL